MESKFKDDLKFRKQIIKIVAEKLGCSVEMIDFRSGFARLRKDGKMILVNLWRGISFENAIKQIAFSVKNS